MIEKISLVKFKRFRSQIIPLARNGISLVAGANNSGKSTILHALAIWEFCRTIIEAEKGFGAFLPESRAQGLGLGDDEFSPVLLPSLSHLWTNLTTQKQQGDADGYTLRIKADWRNADGDDKRLEFGLALANDRMFVKTTDSNLAEGESIPRVAYLPPFAGITDKEARLPLAIRRRKIGEGLAGGVLRNVLLDLQKTNEEKRTGLRQDRPKIRDSDLKELRKSDPWEILQQALRTTFGVELAIKPFRDEYHSYIKVEIIRGDFSGYKIKRYPKYKARDLMVEGSGFLQWLSVYALATDPSISTLLLDEPDAHLHSSLQRQMLEKLEEIASATNKQILIATHSSEILKNAPPAKILEVRRTNAPRFLSKESQKIGLLAGLGSEYSPRIDRIKKSKRLLLVEGAFDVRILKQVANVMGVDWPDSWVEWAAATSHKERKQLFRALAEEIQDLVALSLRDRDDEAINSVGESLADSGHGNSPEGFHCKKWRRRHIESYLLWPPALAATCNLSKQEIEDKLRDDFGIAIGAGYQDENPPRALLDIPGKEVLKSLDINPNDVIHNMTAEDIPNDLKTMVNELVQLA